MKRIDERDIIFSRMGYTEGTEQHKDYYDRNPERKETDDYLRGLPQLGEEGSGLYSSLNSPMINAAFHFLSDIKSLSEGAPADKKAEADPEVITSKIKGLAKFYNAKLVGITEMKDYHYYSHRGRMAQHYGNEITATHKYGIVFALEMDRDMINMAPQLPEGVAVTKGYVDAAVIGMILSYYIRQLGYDARNHMDGNYLVIAPLAAQDAGIGEIGRNGLLITKEFGPRIRLGVVTTDIPLVPDTRDNFGMIDFCIECQRCSKTCPGRAIPSDGQKEIDGVLRWKITPEECYKRWRLMGSDCGVCLASCPFSAEVQRELVEKMKYSPEARQEILEHFNKKHGIRPYIKDAPDWMK
jgi:ferredoxin